MRPLPLPSVPRLSPPALRPQSHSFPSTCLIGPERVYDSREEGGRIVRNETRNLLDGFAFPEEAAYCFNVTLTGTQGSRGFLSVFPGDESWGGSSSINWDRTNQTIANNAYTWLALDDGTVNVHCGTVVGGSTHFILDLVAILSIQDFAVEPANLKAARAARARPARG